MHYLGIDLGGTNIAVGIVDEDCKIVAKVSSSTATENAEQVADAMAATARAALEKAGLTLDDVPWIGVGSPGTVNKATGIIEYANNLPFLNTPMQKMLSERLDGKTVYMENDANAAAFGEYMAGALKGAQVAMAITLGTGVGGGVIIDEKIITGKHGLGGEVGHIHVRDEEKEHCNCGGVGCLEQVASATGIAREARRKMAACDTPSALREAGDQVTAKDVLDAAKAGDALALEVMEVVGHYLGVALASLALTVDPEMFVIGGGVSKAGQYLIEVINRHYGKYMTISENRATIGLAKLGNDAGIYGAARLVLG